TQRTSPVPTMGPHPFLKPLPVRALFIVFSPLLANPALSSPIPERDPPAHSPPPPLGSGPTAPFPPPPTSCMMEVEIWWKLKEGKGPFSLLSGAGLNFFALRAVDGNGGPSGKGLPGRADHPCKRRRNFPKRKSTN